MNNLIPSISETKNGFCCSLVLDHDSEHSVVVLSFRALSFSSRFFRQPYNFELINSHLFSVLSVVFSLIRRLRISYISVVSSYCT